MAQTLRFSSCAAQDSREKEHCTSRLYLSPSPRPPTTKSMVLLDRERMGSRQPRYGPLRDKTLEYIAEYDCFIPRASAFGIMAKEDIQAMVNRLYSPRQSTTRDKYHRKCIQLPTLTAAMPKVLGKRPTSREDIFLLIKRLGKPTQMSILRETKPNHLKFLRD